MLIGKTRLFGDQASWRKWLEKYSQKEKEIWVIIYKKHTTKKSISYEKAVEEALCFGWIDGVMKSIDDEKFAQRFSPRSADSVWSLLNKKRALKMIREGKMTPAGLEKIKYAKVNGKWQAAYSSKKSPGLPPDLKSRFKENRIAYKNFLNFTNSQKLGYIYWILSARKTGTRNNRINIVVERSHNNLKSF